MERRLTEQVEGESVESYLLRFMNTAQKISDKRMSEERKVERLLDGLKGELGMLSRFQVKVDQKASKSISIQHAVTVIRDCLGSIDPERNSWERRIEKSGCENVQKGKISGITTPKDQSTVVNQYQVLEKKFAQLALRLDRELGGQPRREKRMSMGPNKGVYRDRRQENRMNSGCYICGDPNHYMRDHDQEMRLLEEDAYFQERKRPRTEGSYHPKEFLDMEASEGSSRRDREERDRKVKFQELRDARARRFENRKKEDSVDKDRPNGPSVRFQTTRNDVRTKSSDQDKRPMQKSLRPIPLMKGQPEYSVQDTLRKTVSDITLGQLMQISPQARNEFLKSVRPIRKGQNQDEEMTLLEELCEGEQEILEEEYFMEEVSSDDGMFIEELEENDGVLTPLREESDAKRVEIRGYDGTKGAPRAVGKLSSGRQVAIILDGGSYSNIISEAVAKENGLIVESEEKVRLIMADGSRSKPVGKVKDMPIYFDEFYVNVNALVMKNPDYSVLLGRKFLKQMRIITDWEKNLFFLRDPEYGRRNIPMGSKFDEERVEGSIMKEKEMKKVDNSKLETGEDPEAGFDIFEEEEYYSGSDRYDGYIENLNWGDKDSLLLSAGKGSPDNKKDNFSSYLISLPARENSDEGGVMLQGKMEALLMAMEKDGDLRDQGNLRQNEREARRNEIERKDELSKVIANQVETIANKFKNKFGSELRNLLKEFEDIMALDISDIKKPANLPQLEIELKGNPVPIRKRAFRLPPRMVQEMKGFVYDMWRNGLVEPTRGEWGFEMFGVPKPNGKLRWVVNFKPLNEKTVGDGYPLPRMDDLRDRLGGSTVFSSIDFLSGFHQGPIGKKSQKYFTFITPFGQFSYLVLPMGPKPVPAHFQRCMDMTFGEFNDFTEIYIDDLNIHSREPEEHGFHLRRVFERCREVGLKIGITKCKFFQKELRVLGVKVSAKGLGVFEKRFIVKTDASKHGLGAMLVQKDDHGKERIIRYWSKTVPKRMKEYPTYELELMAVVGALKAFRHYLISEEFDLHTDNKALVELLKRTDWSGKMARWVATIQEFTFKPKHIKGEENPTDGLSRLETEESEEWEPVELFNAENEETIISVARHQWFGEVEDDEEVERVRVRDIWESCLSTRNRILVEERLSVKKVRHLREQLKKFRLDQESGILMRKTVDGWREYVTQRRRSAVLKEIHDGSGHFGIEAGFARLKSRYWWPQYYESVKRWVASCEQCQQEARRNRVVPETRIVVEQVFERWGFDFVGPIKCEDGKERWILTAVEYVTRWPEAAVTESTTAETFADFLYKMIITRFGPPASILTDNGPAFRNQLMQEIMKMMSMKHYFATKYHPQTAGLVEHFNGVIWTMIRKEGSKDWYNNLESYLYSYRVKKIAGERFSPFELLYGVDSRPGNKVALPKERGRKLVLRKRLEQLMKSREDRNQLVTRKKQLAEKIRERAARINITYQVGDRVDLFNYRMGRKREKNEQKWLGTYEVVDVGSNGSYWISKPGDSDRHLINQTYLRKHVDRDDHFRTEDRVGGEN